VIVRKATSEDSAKLLEFIELKAEFDRAMKGFTGEISTTIGKIESTLFGHVPYAHALILEVEGEALGFALFHYRYSSFKGEPSVWLDDLLVDLEHRSNGYGEALMQELMAYAKSMSMSHIAWTASPFNKKGHMFYQRLGAEIERMDGDRPYFRWAVNG
jgi:GNAT superfamily N-acetyltransferase